MAVIADNDVIVHRDAKRLCDADGRFSGSHVRDKQHLQETRMTNSEDRLPAVGAYWIKEEDYPALREIFDDGDKLPPTWKEWLTMAEEMERGLKAYGHPVLRVYIDPRTFPDWCAAHDTSPGRAGRKKLVAAAVTERYGDQS
jgi:hypothetical protein